MNKINAELLRGFCVRLGCLERCDSRQVTRLTRSNRKTDSNERVGGGRWT